VSRARLLEHRRLWDEKPLLARLYAPWFEALLREVPHGARVVEVGAGPGTLRAFARERRPDLRYVATDLEPVPWNHVAADAARLPLRSGSAEALVGLDVLHHLAEPSTFFLEAGRVLAPGGRLALVEPWLSPLSWPIYRFLHEEDCRLSGDPWRPFPGSAKAAFEGDAALPWRLLRAACEDDWLRLGFGPPRVVRIPTFAYLLSLGFRRASLLPRPLAGPMLALDRALSPLGRLVALRASLVWAKAAAARTDARATGAGPVESC
jgi:SAM-dependent methyltransferase